MATRDDIIRELEAGETPYRLSKKYPRASVYRIYNELLVDGQLLEEPQNIDTELETEEEEEVGEHPPFVPVTSTTKIKTTKAKAGAGTGAEIISSSATLPADAINRIRGILGITLRPKVLSCPMPELLYPSMVIAVTELGFPAMRPDDFIDTVLYQWLDACDYIPYAYMKKSELEEITKERGIDEGYIKEHGLMTEDEFAKKYGMVLLEPEPEIEGGRMDEENVENDEIVDEMAEDEGVATEKAGDEPHKPTVGELLGRLHINNIQKEVEKNGSEGCAESDNPQGEYEPRE